MKIKRLTENTAIARVLTWLAGLVFRHRRLVLYPQLVLFVLCVGYTVGFLQFDTSRNNLVGSNKKYHQNFLKFKKEFPTQDDLVVVVESENSEKNRQFVERLGARLEAETNLFHDVFYKGDLKALGPKALLFVPENDLAELSKKLQEYRPFIEQFARTTNLVSLFNMVNAQFRTAKEEENAENQSLVQALPALERIITQAKDSLRRLGTPPSPGITALFGAGDPTAFSAGDLSDLESLSAKLRRPAPTDGVSQYLSSQLPDATQKLLSNFTPDSRWRLQYALTEDLNRVIRSGPIYDPQRFAGTKLSPETSDLLGQHPQGADLVRLNRMLLLDAFPGELSESLGAGEAEQQVYISFAYGRIFLVTAQAPREDLNSAAVDRLRELVQQTKTEVPGLNVGLTGEPVLENDEMAQSQKDTLVASIASLLICALIFIYGYQSTGRPVKATLCLLVGLAYTLAFATLTVGHLNILTITFVPILIGLAIDYGVHLISRYEEELRRGRSEQAALTKAMVFTGQGIFTGAFTTAGAFLAMGLTNFKGIQEMGVICGGGLLICLVPMMTLLPVLLLRGRQNVLDHQLGDLDARRARIENIWLQRPVWVGGVTLALCALAFSQVARRKVHFDYNLLNMQSAGLPAVVFEEKLIESTPKSVLFAAVIATNLEQAVALEQQITNLPSVSSVESMTRFLTEDQRRKLATVSEIKREVASICFPEADAGAVAIPELSRTLYSLSGYVGLAREKTQKDKPVLGKQFASMHQAIEDLRKEMLWGDAQRVASNSLKLAQFQRALFDDLRQTFQAFQTQDDRSPLRVEDLPPSLHDRFIGVTGKYLLMVYPKEDVWQRENQKKFIHDLRQVDQDVTGTPVQLYEYTTLLKNSYQDAAWYSLAAITLLVFVHFRSPLSVVLALIPVGVGFLWLCGLMGAFNVPFNPANIMTLPLVIGIGVTNGIHILNRFAEEQTPSILARSTGKAVLVSGLTAIAGFGSLILAQHRGIRSLGYVMSLGIATCMIAGLTFLPALLNLLPRLKLLRKTQTGASSGAPVSDPASPPTSLPANKQPSADGASSDTGSGGTEVKTSSMRIL
jgi:hopanoid biosynthesis associated RND transporter like protein HpnN